MFGAQPQDRPEDRSFSAAPENVISLGEKKVESLIAQGDVEGLQRIAEVTEVKVGDRELGVQEDGSPFTIDASWDYDENGNSEKLEAFKRYVAENNNILPEVEFYKQCIQIIQDMLTARQFLQRRQGSQEHTL